MREQVGYRTASDLAALRNNPPMNLESTQLLQVLLHQRRVAALGTLQDGEPAVSMVPFVSSPDGGRLVIHVSGLAAHTRNLQASPAVSLMVMDDDRPEQMPQALPRVSLQGQARVVVVGDPGYTEAKAWYLAKFPDAADLFEFPDFRLVVVEVREARLVAGFARAHTLYPVDLARHLGGLTAPGAS